MAVEALAHHFSGSLPLKTDSFALLYPSGKLIEDWSSTSSHVADAADIKDWSSESVLLDGEIILQGGNNTTDSLRANSTGPLVVLYANLGTRSFAQMYQHLLESQLRFVVRHFGGATEDGETVSSPVTVLQGYGVSLDIRNIEYKVFDDRSEKGSRDDRQFLNLSDTSLRAPSVFLAGVNVTYLESTMNEAERLQLQASLWRRHDVLQLQSQIVPPVWQRRQLPLQATAVIVNSTDPLATLEEISQNLPSLASTLVHVKIPEDLVNGTKGLKPYVGRIYLNGCPLQLGHPTFNVFEFMNVLRDEQLSLSSMQKNLSPFLNLSQLRMVQQAWSMGSDFLKETKQLTAEDDDEYLEDFEDDRDKHESVFRVDVGHGWKQAVIYLNDVEKDVQYSRWPVRLEQMLMMMQFGRPPSVRRNLFTFLSVVDPTEEGRDDGLKLAMQVMSAGYPARTGILIVNKDQVRECAKWVVDNNIEEGIACPMGPVLKSKPASMDDLASIKASTQAVHSLLANFARAHGDQGDGALQAYAEYLFEYISNEKAKKDGGDLSMRDLVAIHGSLLAGLNIRSEKEGELEAFDALLEGEQEREDFSYAKALRFAVDRALSPGLSFINGRPMPTDGHGAAEIFRAEQGFIVNSVIAGEITDRAPKSVYGNLLTGDLVFKSFHPLLRGDTDIESKYIDLSYVSSLHSLLTPMSETESSEASAMFVLEAVVDYATIEGVKLLKTIVDMLSSQRPQPSPTESEGIMLAYRFLPGSSEAAKSSLCPFLAQASVMNLQILKEVIEVFSADLSASFEALLDAVPSVSRSIAQSITSATALDQCRSSAVSDPKISGNFMVLNGRKFTIDAGTVVDRNTVDVLVRLEQKRAKAVVHLLRKAGKLTYDGVSRTAAFLAREETLADGGYKRRRSSPFASMLKSSEPLRLSWNHEAGDQNQELQVRFTRSRSYSR
jgi:UDP-glucose:glycoprotein glucosyltransferase